jgi:SAM-dependent methyltransferase
MGFDTNGVRFLLEAKHAQVNFEQCVMLGRQEMHVTLNELQRIFDKQGLTLSPLQAQRLLDNPVGGRPGFAESFLNYLGGQNIFSIDYSDFENATHICDLNTAVPDELIGACDCVIDGGTLEHVFNFPMAVRNSQRLVKPGGHFLSITPCNNFMGHGFYQFSPELFFRIFSGRTGFELQRLFIAEDRKFAKWYWVEDPNQIGQRVTLTNKQPTYLLVQARRIEPKELADIMPQQSDYERRWRQHATDETAVQNDQAWYTTIKRIMPRGIRKRIKRIITPTFSRPKYKEYK